MIAYIAKDSPQNAELVLSRILDSAGKLTSMPRSGRIGRVPGTREKIVSRTPYILIYKFSPKQLRILRIFRGARKWPGIFS